MSLAVNSIVSWMVYAFVSGKFIEALIFGSRMHQLTQPSFFPRHAACVNTGKEVCRPRKTTSAPAEYLSMSKSIYVCIYIYIWLGYIWMGLSEDRVPIYMADGGSNLIFPSI